MPQSRFWMAIASAKVSRSQPRATVIGSRNRPKTERTPNPTMAIRQPARMIAAGVRQTGTVLDREAVDIGATLG